MNTRAIAIVLGAACAILAVVAACFNAVPVAAGPAVQVTFTPRAPLTPTPLPSTSQQPVRPPRLHGTIFDWGKGNMPAGVRVVLRGDGWEIPVETDSTGHYVFQDIGNEVGWLTAYAPADRPDLVPMASDLPVRVRVDGELIVNLALIPEGTEPNPLLSLEVITSSPEVARGENVSFVISAINEWDQGINQVIVADYLPTGLMYVSASTSQGSVDYYDGLVWAEMGPMATGGTATVTIMARVADDVEPGTVIDSLVAAYHSENAAVTAEAAIEVLEHSNGVLPVTGLTPALPAAGVLLAGLLLGVRRLRRQLS